jgi:hypothetical protein
LLRPSGAISLYQDRCIAGEASIGSLTCEFTDGSRHNGATIELERDGTIVQCRGFANRSLNAAMVRRWAEAFGLRW